MKQIEEYVRSIEDFPEEGIIFRDVTSAIITKILMEWRKHIKR